MDLSIANAHDEGSGRDGDHLWSGQQLWGSLILGLAGHE
jgi:hypothetical protein